MDYIDNINEHLANRIVSRVKPDIVAFCVKNEIGYGDSDEFIEQFDVTEFDDFSMLLNEEIANAAMYYSDAYEILRKVTGFSRHDILIEPVRDMSEEEKALFCSLRNFLYKGCL